MTDVHGKAEAKKTLLKQAATLNMEVDKRWSVDTLAEKVAEAHENFAEREADAIRESSDTWVYLNKPAFPIADEKHEAGETIKVPSEMAERWYEAGIARPGKPQAG